MQYETLLRYHTFSYCENDIDDIFYSRVNTLKYFVLNQSICLSLHLDLQPLDYEGSPQVDLTITLDNEIPYYFCEVIKRTDSKLWQISGGKAGATGQASTSSQSMSVTVSVEDVNEAPVFNERIKQAKVAENGEKGIHLAKFTAHDPDIMQPNSFV